MHKMTAAEVEQFEALTDNVAKAAIEVDAADDNYADALTRKHSAEDAHRKAEVALKEFLEKFTNPRAGREVKHG
jgi:hypothetical protein